MSVRNPDDESWPESQANAAQFHTTLWTEVVTAGDRSSPQAEAALARLCQTYWLPVYAFIRKRGSSREEAADLTQNFFAKFPEMNYVARAKRGRGRFRSFLMSSLENFLHDEHDRASTLKCGGGQPTLSLDAALAEKEFLEESTETLTPASAFEKQWASTLLHQVMERLAAERRENGRGLQPVRNSAGDSVRRRRRPALVATNGAANGANLPASWLHSGCDL